MSSISVDGPSASGFEAFTHTAVVVNSALLTGHPEHFGVLRFCVNDSGWPLNRRFAPSAHPRGPERGRAHGARSGVGCASYS